MSIDDKVLEEIHGAVKHVQGIVYSEPYKKYQDGLSTIMAKLIADNNGKFVFKDDKQKREISDKIWEEAADIVAKHYLNLSDDMIKQLKELKDADGISNFENMVAQNLGFQKKEFYDNFFESVEYLDWQVADSVREQMLDRHRRLRTGKYLNNVIKTEAHAEAATQYLTDAKKKNPNRFQGIKIKKMTSTEDAINAIAQYGSLIPETYSPIVDGKYQK